MKKIQKLTIWLTGLVILILPSTVTASGVTGINLVTANDAIYINWQDSNDPNTDHYEIYYAKQSIIQNNGRFDDSDITISNETSLIVTDLENRGFMPGDEMYVSIAAVNSNGEKTALAEEKSIIVKIPGTNSVDTVPHNAGNEEVIQNQNTIEQNIPVQINQPVANQNFTPDITPPEDPRNLTLRKKLQENGNYTVYATWAPSMSSVDDLASYNLYESDDVGATFVGPTVLLGTVLSATIANVPPGTFTLKISAMDMSKNESQGIIKSIVLPETGGAALIISFIGAGLYSIRRRCPVVSG
ncbi:hypothetical protein HOF56_01000 [Candidatus Peribacteria bacterium]|nr:hypothetical protein [Candidatus Peribacteria bacterium]MBT4020851.1 hypothetical protein [Candidatus Peribacteria bacterium]MBT4241140.1 hypothetical protein [Candidatus Peribacteria bacterium]MBT4473862.1 hypothetical protein [Candidatus Peribacteria bacterium]